MIHKYQQNGFNIVIDVNSGAIHIVDELTYKLLDYIENEIPTDVCPEKAIDDLSSEYSKTDIEETYAEIVELYKTEQLFTIDDYEKYTNMMIKSPVKSMCLNIAHDCNLRCEYCFAGKGDYHEGRMLMSEEVGIKAIDFLLKNSGDRHNLELDFFGGEPLMNLDVVKKVVLYARSKEKEYNKLFRFTMTTNGMLLTDDVIDFLCKEMNNIVLSIDGRKEINDRTRKRIDGTGCYDAILPKFQKLVKQRGDGQYYVRGTFTKWNKDFSNDVLHMNEMGFDQISVEPCVSDPKYDYSLSQEDLPEIFAEYEKLAKIMIYRKKAGKGFNFFHFMIDLEQGPCAIKRLRGCSCGNEYIAVDPDGSIYPCHQFVGKEEWKMGNIYDGVLDDNIRNQFVKCNIYTKDECSKCWAKFYCSGGCNANGLEYAGDIHKPFKLACEMEKKRVECAIMI
ncbi:MAG: thioether cross-link-forming SCIFF peptide maturase, partial [Oscillospiraceae bacterium]